MIKISKAQMEVLKRLATGDYMYVEDTYMSHRAYFPSTQETINHRTAANLIDAELVEKASPATKRHERDYRGTWKLSDTGRSLVEQEAAKEVEAQ